MLSVFLEIRKKNLNLYSFYTNKKNNLIACLPDVMNIMLNKLN